MSRRARPIPDWVLDAIGGLANTGGVVALGEVRAGRDRSPSPWPSFFEALGAHWSDVEPPSFCIVRPPFAAFGLDGGSEDSGRCLAEHIIDALEPIGATVTFGVGATGRGGPSAEHAGRRALRALDAARRLREQGRSVVVSWSQTRKA